MRASPPPADVPVRRVGSSREHIVGAAASTALSDRRIALAGITAASRDYLFIRDQPTRGQIIACVSGRGRVLVGGEWVACTPGSFYLAPIGAPHGYGSASARWGICWVTYDGGIVRVAAPCLIRADSAPLLASITGLHDEARGASDPTILRQWTDLVHAQVVRVLALSPEASRLWP
ncbi:MAG: AraC family ligand binding domain-containing protein, partial [Planctomycetes bacterium]|nr:AraC family ligand binding domain-containing protein [Planctomycetota bacterium]